MYCGVMQQQKQENVIVRKFNNFQREVIEIGSINLRLTQFP